MGRNPSVDAKRGVAFGSFRLFAAERLLERQGVELSLSSRALDILIVLVERAGEIVSKKDLMARAWPNLTVDEASLRVHVAGLRKILGDGRDGARYVTNVPGRGYCFVAPLHPVEPTPAARTDADHIDHAHNLPPPLARMVGRDEVVRTLIESLATQRFVTVVGPGGIGKTTVAISVGHAQLDEFKGAVRFLDLGSISDGCMLPTAVASALGLLVQSNDPIPSLINVCKKQRILLILDSCEHLIEAAAALTERIFQEAPDTYVLATSREAIRAEGEHVYRLPALDSPPEGVSLTAAEVLAFPAVHLLVERAASSGHRFELTDVDAPIVAEICRKLDGIALAIELAAGRVSAHGLHETATLLENRLGLLSRGRRTALPRHQTLSATLDWSYDLLSDLERVALRRLAVFVGGFTLDAAQAVAADDEFDSAQIVDAVGSLVDKSLISTSHGIATQYRLLDTTRAYAFAKLLDSGEAALMARRHADYYREVLEADQAHNHLGDSSDTLANVRAALERSFSNGGDIRSGTRLAAAATRLFLRRSLLSECHHWTERALLALDDDTRATRCEMEIQSALGHSLMFTKGNGDQVEAALARGLEIAEDLEDRFSQFRLLGRLHIYHRRKGNFRLLLPIAQRAEAIAAEIADPVGVTASHVLLGASHHLVGDQAEARNHLEAALRPPAPSHSSSMRQFSFQLPDPRDAQITLARTLWLQGFPDQAVQVARQMEKETTTPQDPVTFCIPFIWGAPLCRWIGDWDRLEENTERLIAHADKHSLEPYLAVGHGLKGEVLIKRGEIERGIDLLRGSLATLHADRYELYTAGFSCVLAEALAMSGHLDQALTTIEAAIARIAPDGPSFNMPELLRICGEVRSLATDERGAEECFQHSIALGDRQSSLSWQLRAATSFARLRLRQGRHDEARTMLAETYARFNEGFDTVDLKAAKQVLDETHRRVAHR